MTQTQEREAVPAAERAEQIASHLGEQLGQLAGRATLRVQQAAHALREGVEGAGSHEGSQSQAQAQGDHPERTERTERAEALVDQLGERVSHWGLASNLRVKKATARLRESAEDLWVEAQEKRRAWEGKRG